MNFYETLLGKIQQLMENARQSLDVLPCHEEGMHREGEITEDYEEKLKKLHNLMLEVNDQVTTLVLELPE